MLLRDHVVYGVSRVGVAEVPRHVHRREPVRPVRQREPADPCPRRREHEVVDALRPVRGEWVCVGIRGGADETEAVAVAEACVDTPTSVGADPSRQRFLIDRG